MSRSILPPAAIDYPTSDGKPLAENDAQARAILYAFGALRVHYEARWDVYVSADLLIYYEEGNPRGVGCARCAVGCWKGNYRANGQKATVFLVLSRDYSRLCAETRNLMRLGRCMRSPGVAIELHFGINV